MDRAPIADDDPAWGGLALVGMLGLIGLVFLALEITRGLVCTPFWQSMSRILVSIAFFIGLLALLLSGVRAEVYACRGDPCGGSDEPATRASPYDLVELLAWHSADVIPALDLTGALEWDRPATLSDPLARTAAGAIRVFVIVIAVGVLAQLRRSVTKPGDRPLTFGDLRSAQAAGEPPEE